MRRAGTWYLVLGVAARLTAGCKTEDPPSPWEIVHGTAQLTASKAVHDSSLLVWVDYSGRTGRITVAADSTISGVIHYPGSDSAVFTGTITFPVGQDPVMSLTGITPGVYTVLTDPGFSSTYGLVSTDIINSDVTGDAVAERHRIYWEFQR